MALLTPRSTDSFRDGFSQQIQLRCLRILSVLLPGPWRPHPQIDTKTLPWRRCCRLAFYSSLEWEELSSRTSWNSSSCTSETKMCQVPTSKPAFKVRAMPWAGWRWPEFPNTSLATGRVGGGDTVKLGLDQGQAAFGGGILLLTPRVVQQKGVQWIGKHVRHCFWLKNL